MAVMAVAAVVMAAAVAAVLDAGMAAAGMLSGEHAQGSKATVVGTAGAGEAQRRRRHRLMTVHRMRSSSPLRCRKSTARTLR